LLVATSAVKHSEAVAAASEQSTRATNLVRHLTSRTANDLDCANYVKDATKLAKAHGLKTEFYGERELAKLKAGAFLAVSQGSSHRDAGILKISYRPTSPKKSARAVALVGKGITFDTGGVNVKTGTYMYGMHGDMAGSAVALALTLLASEQQWQFPVTAYLAIADNAISNIAYRPNEVVTSMSGRTIEIVHTDAEGRMVLADTLCLASKDEPAIILDFATLTGACVRAIGTTYCGAFTNNIKLNKHIIKAGRRSGERVWPFPMDSDFAESLKSEVADTKQCRLTGGVDHIEAAMFLKEFVGKGIDWVHTDMSAIEHDGGLAHIGDKVTGIGVRYAVELLRLLERK